MTGTAQRLEQHGYRHKPRIYKMESFGYKGKAVGDAPLKDILTAVPD